MRSIADRLRRIGRAQDTIARLSGDEFAVILTCVPDPAATEVVARKIIAAVQDTHALDQHEVQVSCSVGIAIFPTDATTPEGLLHAADAAGYHAKAFRNTFRRYSSETEQVRPGHVAVSALRRAIEAGDLAVHYQPQLCLRTRRITGLEALVRWSAADPGGVPTSERFGSPKTRVDRRIFDFVLGTTMDQVMAWKRLSHLSSLVLAVNLSAAQLRDHTVVSVVERYLRETGFPPADSSSRSPKPPRCCRIPPGRCWRLSRRSASASRSTILAPGIRRLAGFSGCRWTP